MPRNGWIRNVPRSELDLIHRVLRLQLLQEPSLLDEDEHLQCRLLADMLWAEGVVRGREEVSTS